MADKQAQAMERLTAKLTALRKTLRGEERKLLDSMVLAARAEVSAHSKSMRPVARLTTAKSSDMELHSAQVRRLDVGAKTASASARKSAGPEATKSMEAEGRVWMGITLEGGAYKASVL
jgi:hypothetical protein